MVHEIDGRDPLGTKEEFETLIQQLDAKTQKGQTIGIEMTAGVLKSFDEVMKLSGSERKKIVEGMNPQQLFLYRLLKFCRNKKLKPVPLQSLSVLGEIMKKEREHFVGDFDLLEYSLNKDTLRKARHAKRAEELLTWPVMEKAMLRRTLRLKLDNVAVGFNHAEPMIQEGSIELANPEMYEKYMAASRYSKQGPERARHIRKLYRRIKRMRQKRNNRPVRHPKKVL